MGLLKKKVDNALVGDLLNYREADYEKASPELKKIYECLVFSTFISSHAIIICWFG